MRITYDSKTIDLKVGPNGLQAEPTQNFKQNPSSSGLIEQINIYGTESVTLDVHFDQDVYDKLYAFWWGWARFGEEFSFAVDHTKTANTTLDGATSGAVIPLAVTTGLVVGDRCLLIADGDNEREIITINSISDGVSVTAEENVKFSYASGDAFRHVAYYPALINLNKAFKPSKTGDWYAYQLKWTEAL